MFLVIETKLNLTWSAAGMCPAADFSHRSANYVWSLMLIAFCRQIAEVELSLGG